MLNYPEEEKKWIIQSFKKRFKLNFKETPILLQALTHESYCHEKKNKFPSYEKLEFLGDTVLNLIISQYLYEKYPYFSVGQLAKTKAKLISRAILTTFGKKIQLGKYLFLGKGEEARGGRNRDSIISDSHEAVIGAIYLDQGMEKARNFVLQNFSEILEEINIKELDHKTTLQEYLQKKYKKLPVYKLADESGPAHQKIFTVQVWFKGQKLGTGRGNSKKAAEQAAAKKALKNYETR